MKKTLFTLTLASSTLAFFTATQTHPIQLKGTLTTNLFRLLSQYDESYSKAALKFLTQFTLVRNSGYVEVKDMILTDFDRLGDCIRGVQLLGFAGIELGPASYSPQPTTLGLPHLKSSINAYLEQFHSDPADPAHSLALKNARIKKFKIGIRLIPDKEVIEYTPYLVEENIGICVRSLGNLEEEGEEADRVDGRILGEKEKDMGKGKEKGKQGKEKQNGDSLIDFITIDSDTITQQLGPQALPESTLLLNSLKTFLTIQSASGPRHAIYELHNKSRQPVYLPAMDRSRQGIYGAGYRFVSWRELIGEIVGDGGKGSEGGEGSGGVGGG